MKKKIGILLAMLPFSCQSKEKDIILPQIKQPIKMEMQEKIEVATFAGGCFGVQRLFF